MWKRTVVLVALTSALLAACSAVQAGQAKFDIGWSNVGDPNNTATSFGMGSVATQYAIGTYEVTNEQYAAFLNAVAKKDTKGLYNTYMAGKVNKSKNPLGLGGIIRTGKSGSYVYTLKPGSEDLPVNFVSYNDSLRFVNWVANGQLTGVIGNTTTERGTYNMSLSNPVKAANASIWLPSENEWFKAAYYKGGSVNAGYWSFATQSNNAPTAGAPAGGANAANYQNVGPAVGAPDYFNQVGAYLSTVSAYGAHDMNGNAWEWTDGVYGSTSKRAYRGGAFDSTMTALGNVYRTGGSKTYEAADLGFRVAGTFVPLAIPEPATLTLLAMGGLAVLRRKRK